MTGAERIKVLYGKVKVFKSLRKRKRKRDRSKSTTEKGAKGGQRGGEESVGSCRSASA